MGTPHRVGALRFSWQLYPFSTNTDTHTNTRSHLYSRPAFVVFVIFFKYIYIYLYIHSRSQFLVPDLITKLEQIVCLIFLASFGPCSLCYCSCSRYCFLLLQCISCSCHWSHCTPYRRNSRGHQHRTAQQHSPKCGRQHEARSLNDILYNYNNFPIAKRNWKVNQNFVNLT